LQKSLECVKCGACCLGVTLPIEEEVLGETLNKEIIEKTGIPIKARKAECRIHGVCKNLNLETRECKDYENRPEECRRFKCWENQAWLYHFFTIYRIATQGGYREFNDFVEFVNMTEQKLKEMNDARAE